MKSNLNIFRVFLCIALVKLNPTIAICQNDSIKQEKFIDSLCIAEMIQRRTVDEFTDEIKINCPVLGNPKSTIQISKVIKDNNSQYFVSLMARGDVSFNGGKGLIILFNDGSKLQKPNEDYDILDSYGNSGYQYLTLFVPSKDDLKQLSIKCIKKFRIFDFVGEVNERDARLFRGYVRNITLTK